MGYALAKDHYCILIDQIVRVRGERARYFGPEHIDADLGWKALNVLGQAEQGFATMDTDIQENLIGYTAGVNHYVQTHGESLPESCRSAP